MILIVIALCVIVYMTIGWFYGLSLAVRRRDAENALSYILLWPFLLASDGPGNVVRGRLKKIDAEDAQKKVMQDALTALEDELKHPPKDELKHPPNDPALMFCSAGAASGHRCGNAADPKTGRCKAHTIKTAVR